MTTASVGAAADDFTRDTRPECDRVAARGAAQANARRTRAAIRVAPWVAAWLVIFLILAWLPGRAAIPPEVESDYCYSLLAAERFSQGKGFTSLDPAAPFQPWHYRADFVFLTKWPVGYPFLVWLARAVSGGTTLAAASWMAVAACATALLGWYACIRAIAPGGTWSMLAALAGSAASVSTAALINPRTDTLVLAALPWLLLLAMKLAIDRPRRTAAFAGLGAAAASLCWIRYAAVFAPAAIGLWLAALLLRKRLRAIELLAYAAGCAAPIAALLAVNRAFGAADSTASQLNLGQRLTLNVEPRMLLTAWWNLTNLGFYDYRPQVHTCLAAAPLALAGLALLRRTRQRLIEFILRPGVMLGAAVIVVLVVELVGATALFGDKYNYVALGRYYEPARPLLWTLMVGAAACTGWRIRKPLIALGAVIALHWTLTCAWPRPYLRWLRASREVAPSGAWAQAFSPEAPRLYALLRETAGDDLILFSNFHDYLAWETGLPALPLPQDRIQAAQWISEVQRTRGLAVSRVVFALDPSPRWRAHYLPQTPSLIEALGLVPLDGCKSGAGWALYRMSDDVALAAPVPAAAP